MLFRNALPGLLALIVGASSIPAQANSPRKAEIDLYARLLAMTDTRTLDLTLIDQALSSNWQPLRRAASLAIGQVGSEVGRPGVPKLESLLSDSDVEVSANAAYALGLLRDTTSIPALVRSLSGNREVTREAAWALGEIGSPARSAIVRALTAVNDAQDNATTIQLLLAAAKLRPVPATAIEPYLSRKHPSVEWAAAYAIARTRSPAGVRDLIRLDSSLRTTERNAHPKVADAGPYVDAATGEARARAEIARGIAKSAAGDSLGAGAFDLLSRMANDSDPHVRINALRSIATYGANARQIVVAGTRDSDPNVRIAAVQSLSTVLKPGDTDFAALWAKDTSIVYRSSLLASAARAGLRPPQLAAWARSTDWRMRAAVANAAGDSLDRSFAISRNLALIHDPDARVREAAYGALAPPASAPLEDSVRAALLTGLHDRDFSVRATVLGALADRPSAADLPSVLASYKQAATDSANDARLAALHYVSALWKKDSSAVLNSASDLSALPVPTDPLERSAAKSVPVWKDWRTVAATPRSPEWYVSIVREVVVPAATGHSPTVTIYTVRGPIRVELFGTDAPITVYNFLSLARKGYYRNTSFHRVVPNFVAQDGDPRDDGNGGPGYSIRDEMNRRRYERGAVGMALSGPDTGGSQYFITHSPQPHLDGHYTVFGRVVSGYAVLDHIVQGDLISRVEPK